MPIILYEQPGLKLSVQEGFEQWGLEDAFSHSAYYRVAWYSRQVYR